jgi:hypothetical protein
MNISTNSFKLALTLLLVLPVFSIQAATLSVKCDTRSLSAAIKTLHKSASNTINITKDCNEDIVISGHKDLTLIGHDGASITATAFDDTPASPGDPGGVVNSTTAVWVELSNVTFQDLTINGGALAVGCVRSVCELRDVTIPRGWDGVFATDHSELYILGSSMITTNDLGVGVAAYSNSHLGISRGGLGGAGPVIAGNYVGVWVQESFLRSDNATITFSEAGIYARRNSTIRVYSQTGGEVRNNTWGIYLESS